MQADATRLGRFRLLVGVSLFLAALVFYLSNLTHLAPCSFASNNGPFLGGDPHNIASAMRHLTFSGDMRKHLLFSVVTRPQVTTIGRLLGVDENTAIVYVLGAIAATAVTSTWWVLARHVTTALYALLFAVVYGVAFVNLILFSVPETYAVTGLAIIGYFWLLLSRAPGNSPRDASLHGLAAGLAGLFNPPLLSLLAVSVLHGAERGALRKNVAFAGTALVVAFVVFGLPYALIHGTKILALGLYYTRQLASFDNLAEIEKIVFVYISFFVVSFLSPLDMSVATYSLGHFLNYLTEPRLLLTIMLYAALAFVCVKCRDRLGGQIARADPRLDFPDGDLLHLFQPGGGRTLRRPNRVSADPSHGPRHELGAATLSARSRHGRRLRRVVGAAERLGAVPNGFVPCRQPKSVRMMTRAPACGFGRRTGFG